MENQPLKPSPIQQKLEFALDWVLRDEGKTYTNAPHDRGGPTKFGITLKTLSEWHKFEVTASDVEILTEEEARLIYKELYWDAMHLDTISSTEVATAIFDFGVNAGTTHAIKFAQEICGVKEDGVMGPLTSLSVNQMKPASFVGMFCNRLYKYYKAIVDAHPDQKANLNGWMNRVERLRKII